MFLKVNKRVYDLTKLSFEDYKKIAPKGKKRKSDYNQLFKDAGIPTPDQIKKKNEKTDRAD